MVISQIIGGLGNQMFQYAAGRALALRRETALLLDVSSYSARTAGETPRSFELQRVFNHEFGLASEEDVRRVLGWQSSRLVRRIVSHLPQVAPFRTRFVVEPHFHYWSGINALRADCYLAGYWQSENYFADAIPQIRADFAFRHTLKGRNGELANEISRVEAVSLHVRRGDYASHAKTAAIHGLCSLDYYNAAVRHIAAKVARPHFFIFSDDMVWTRNNLKLDFPCIYVGHNQGEEGYNDMRLMSLCRHHIIANSSFSWWGAWLNARADKLVVAPGQWFVRPEDVRDLFPSGWVVL